MIEVNNKKDNLKVKLVAVKMGEEWNISIKGGDKPHIGAVALGIPRKSLQDDTKISSTVSVLTITGHKEDEIVVPVAKKVSSELNSTVVVVCGIHNDDITLEDINIFVGLVNETVSDFICKVKENINFM